MPRCKRPHRHEVAYLPLDEGVPLARQRAIYTRLSDSDADSVSHAQQEDAARRYAAFRGYVVTAIYRDWRTGTDTDRLALKQLVEDAHASMHGGVVFYDHTRLYRGLVGSYPIVRLHSELPSYEFDATAEGFEIEQLATWAFISGNELATTRRRSMDQRRQRAAVGQWMAGNKPYWLKRDPQTREAVIILERAAAVLQAIAQYANGGPMTMVARWMSEHAPANGRHSRWSSTRLRQLFRNPALWGELAYGRSLVLTEVRDGEVVVVGRTVNPDAVPFHVPPLIHYTELERSQCQLAAGCERDSYPAGATLDALIKGNNPRAGARAYQLAEEAADLERMALALRGLDAQENRLYERWDAGDISKNVYKTQTTRIATQRRHAEHQERQLLCNRLLIQRVERATVALRQSLADAVTVSVDRLSLESWSKLLGTVVSDVVLNKSGEPSLRWRRSADLTKAA